MLDSICYLNGRLTPLAEANVSVLDRGFIFGDGIYELVPVFKGVPFRLTEHLQRLRRSLEAVKIDDPLSEPQWTSIIAELVRINRGGDQSVYIQITRGVAPRDHAPPANLQPTVFAMCSPLTTAAEAVPIAAVVLEDIRWQRCDIKSTSLLGNVMCRQAAAAAGVQEAILVRDGFVTEGAASNVFVVTKGRIKTPPLSPRILPGITRDLIVELLSDGGTAVHEEMVSEQELRDAEEIWVTSSSREMSPVVRLDDVPVGSGQIGPIFLEVQRAYRDFKRQVAARLG